MLDRLTISYPGCWYWVDAKSIPVREDPDLPEEADAHYRSFDWLAIGEAARRAVSTAERTGIWTRRRATIRPSVHLTSEERWVLHDWLYLRPPRPTLLTDPADPDIFEGRHRLWLSGQARAWPLPVLSVELSDLVSDDVRPADAIESLRALEDVIGASDSLRALNARDLAVIRRAITSAS